MSTKAERYKHSQKMKFKRVPHHFNRKVMHWFYCSGCGLVALKNEITQKAMRKPCNSMEEA